MWNKKRTSVFSCGLKKLPTGFGNSCERHWSQILAGSPAGKDLPALPAQHLPPAGTSWTHTTDSMVLPNLGLQIPKDGDSSAPQAASSDVWLTVPIPAQPSLLRAGAQDHVMWKHMSACKLLGDSQLTAKMFSLSGVGPLWAPVPAVALVRKAGESFQPPTIQQSCESISAHSQQMGQFTKS